MTKEKSFANDHWPLPMFSNETIRQKIARYKERLSIFLGSDFLPQSPLTNLALTIFDSIDPALISEKRWRNFRVKEIGDMNVATHSLRQACITAQALYFDAEASDISFLERDLMIATAVVHDFGELSTEDFTFDEKQVHKAHLEFEEALQNGVNVPIQIRELILLKNVLLNQWPHVIEADVNGILSPKSLFKNGIARSVIEQSNQLMNLGLDLSFYE